MTPQEKSVAPVVDEQPMHLQAPSVVPPGASVPIRIILLNENFRAIAMQPIFLTCEGGSFEWAAVLNESGEIEEVLHAPYTTAYINEVGEVEGEAEVTWHAPSTPGPVKITAWYFGPEEGQVYSQETTIWVSDDPNLHQVTLFCAPQWMVLGASEDEFVRVFVKVTDAQGNPVSGEIVGLQTTLGEFEERFVVNVDGWDRLITRRSPQISLTTDEFGKAEAILLPPSSPGIATITATTSNGQAKMTYVFSSIEGLHLTSDSYAAVGNEGALIIARLYNSYGEPIAGQVVTFQTTLGQLSSTQAVTDEKGEASVVLIGDGTEGTAVVTASALGYSDKIYVNVFAD